ncbi:hypothetical protein HELRODRAFT_188500 [Helobdella robusta]|uniref:Uncharacterized protein n=1 Tax=Helobdella robusta TaxID=6412 RepID=T1FQ21_HELRO|nr:hypothetical protein HELRODRAFT_188500 [Helobdella robusta]ESO01846.1 hypothetical protein HELRODRAFT_188500 [Helobdella robusta]
MEVDLKSKFNADVGVERKLGNQWELVDAAKSRCYACGQIIEDHFLMNVFPGVKFHEKCLKCVECGKLLDERNVCYCMKAQIYCAHDFNRLFGGKCDNCNVRFGPGEKVMRTQRSTAYHPHCFRCFKCNKLIAAGEPYTLHGTMLFCSLQHKMEAFTTYESANNPNDNNNNNNSFIGTENKIYNTNNKLSSTNNVYNEYNNTYKINNNEHDLSNNTFSLNNNTFDLNYNTFDLNNNNNENNENSSNDTFDLNSNDSSNNNKDIFDPNNHNNTFNLNNSNNNTFNLNNYNINTFNAVDIKWDMKKKSPQMDNYQQENQQNHQHSQQKIELQQPQIYAKLPQHYENIPKHSLDQFLDQQQQPLSTSPTTSSSTLSVSPTSPTESTRKAPRHRTPMTESQLSVLKSFYKTNSRPDGLDRDSLSLITGLHSRVIRVWFQNKRCKDKKEGNAAVSVQTEQ